jgi:SAM-dependent methyltransferase
VNAGHQPDEEYFACMAASAGGHWWYVARRRLVADAFTGELGGRHVRTAPGLSEGTALDVGTGTGEFLDTMAEMGNGLVVGTELSELAARTAARSGTTPRTIVRALAEQIPLADNTVSRLTSLDVVEHLDDDLVALREYRRVCRSGARAVFTVPAYAWLWSEHDNRAAHRRRYRRRQFRAVVERAGFDVEWDSYYFSYLLPPAWLLRRTPLRRLVTVTDEEASSTGGSADRILAGLAVLERRWLRRWRLPVGLSIVCVATAR